VGRSSGAPPVSLAQPTDFAADALTASPPPAPRISFSLSEPRALPKYRSLVPLPQEPGDMGPPKRAVRPYVLDLESTHGTLLNGKRLEPARYTELRSGDVLRFGASVREYVLLPEEAAAGAGGGGAARARG
jgi:hypothetical protein